MNSVWTLSLESFRELLASREPAPAGVTTAAVTATFATALLIKVLEITRNRKSFSGDARAFPALLDAAREESQKLVQFADDDIAAYHAYLADRSADSLRRAIEVPLRAAHSAAAVLRLCQESTGLIPEILAPDLEGAKALLKAAIRAMLVSVEANLAHETDEQFRDATNGRIATFIPLVQI